MSVAELDQPSETQALIGTSSGLYTRLDPSTEQIRVLDLLPGRLGAEIQCRLRVVSLASRPEPKYAALSYSWGSSSERPSITVYSGKHSHAVQITENLFSALQNLRRRVRERTMWIDALCINQDDLVEKTDQVPRMSKIYSTARSTLIWLGVPSHIQESPLICLLPHAVMIFWKLLQTAFQLKLHRLTDDSFPHLRKLSMNFSDVHWLSWYIMNKVPERLASSLDPIESSWVYRVWVIQEYVVSRELHLCYGPAKMRCLSETQWFKLAVAHDAVWGKRGTSYWRTPLTFLKLTWKLGDFAKLRLPSNNSPSLYDVAYLGHGCSATDPRDMVYALLGLVKTKEVDSLRIDYSSPVWETFARATVASIAGTGNFSVLGHVCRPSKAGWPTWAVDFANIAPRLYLTAEHWEDCRIGTLVGDSAPTSPDKAAIGGSHVDVSGDLRSLTATGIYFGEVAQQMRLSARDGSRRSEENSETLLRLATQFFDGLIDIGSRQNDRRRGVSIAQLRAARHADKRQSTYLQPSKEAVGAEMLDADTLDFEVRCWLREYVQEFSLVDPVTREKLSTSSTYFRDYQRRAYEYYKGYAMVGLSNGFVGLAPGDVRRGDAVVFLNGAEWPVLLSPTSETEDSWEFRGIVALQCIGSKEFEQVWKHTQRDQEEFVLI